MSNRDLEIMADERLQAEVVALRKQRNDLLAVCETALGWLKYTRGEKGAALGREVVIEELETAIAAVRGN